MAKTFFEATPTQYKGVRFRSKSEAMFALWLDTAGGGQSDNWVYEPKWLSIDGWVPDFLVYDHKYYREDNPLESLTKIGIVEYKPARPTDAYIENFVNRSTKIALKYETSSMSSKVVAAALYFGSIYNDEQGLFVYEWNPEKLEFDFKPSSFNWVSGHREMLKNYRFDLEGS